MNSKWLANQIICPICRKCAVDPSRIQFHLVKCAEQNPHIKLEVCPFNSTHRFPMEEKEVNSQTKYIMNNDKNITA